MNRTDRLYALAEALRRSGRRGVTASQLAGQFEVSVRTIKRDVLALQESGMPIWAQAGVGGGYFMSSVADLPPVNFTATQAVAVSVALATLPSDSPFTVDARAAAAKVLDALSDADKERAGVLAERVWVLAPESVDADGRIRRSIERSLAERRALEIRYRSADGEITNRVVEPVILAGGSPWYLVAYCRLREAIRWFRFDRIEEAALMKQSYEARPVGDIGTPPERARPAFG